MRTTTYARAATLSLALALYGCGPGEEPPAEDAGLADVGADAADAADVGPPDVSSDADAAEDAAGEDMSTVESTRWTVLVYLAADNNLETSGINDIKEMMSISNADHLELIVQTDRAEDYYELGVSGIENWRESKRLRITNDDVEELASLGELNTGDPQTLEDFMEWGFTTYPSDRRVLILWNHGNAWRGYGNDDSSDHDMLTNDELDDAIGGALETLGVDKLDLLGFDACLMAEDSVLRLARSHAHYMLASEEFEPNHGWDYASLELLVEEPEVDIPAFGEHIAREFRKQARDENRHMAITLSLLDLSKADAALDAVDAFADALAAAIPASGTQIAEALAETQEYGRSADEAKSYHSIDLVDFAERLEPLGGDVAARGDAMNAAIADMVLFELSGTRTRDSNGLAAYFPRLTEHYDAGFDQIGGVERWRAMVRAYHGLVDAGAPTPQLNKSGGVPSTGTCGDGVCEATLGEDPDGCAIDCARTGPTYDLPACDQLAKDPAAPSNAPRTFPVCHGDYSMRCTWGPHGSWVRQVDYCGAGRECGPPIGAAADASWPANYGTCRALAQTQGSSCTPQGELALERQVDMNTMASITRSYLNFGFFPTGGGAPLIVGRAPAEVDAQTGRLSTSWNQRLLTAEQGGFTAVLFAESTRDQDEPALVLHEIPVEYTEPAECACDLPGDPGFADTDEDQIADCLDDDDDGDGVPDAQDNCPFIENQAQVDSDSDGTGDACASSSGEPAITCSPDPDNLFGERQTAYLHVVTNEVTRKNLSWTLYVRTPGGVAGATPLPGARIWPRVLGVDAEGETQWSSPAPLPFNLLRPLNFVYNDLSGQLVVDERGVPALNQNGSAATLADTLGLEQFFLELAVENLAGEADRSGVIGREADVSAQGCTPQDPPLCPAGQIADCDGRCFPSGLLGDGTCHEGSGDTANFACQARAYDRNDCPAPACPAGLEADCDGRCFPAVTARTGDGTCHDGTNRALPRLSCESFGYDGGDCPCGDQCSGQGTCQSDACVCAGGYTGAYCQTPPACGDGTCGADESCRSCAADCGACPSACGNGVCQVNAGEDCANCAADCGACACGDGQCSDQEDCTSCAADCGECPQCGDTVCQAYTAGANFAPAQGESCFDCPSDCGACQNDCCTPSEDSGLWPVGGGCSDATVAQCVCDLDPTCCEAGWPARCRDLAASSCGLSCCTPDCSGKDCGPDGCGGTCGSCGGDTVCATSLTCEPPPRQDCCGPYPASGCGSDNVCESCVCAVDPTCCSGDWDEGCSAIANLQCNTECGCACVPDCAGKACGDDGCGGTCGACGAAETCNPTTGACASAACAMGTDECDGDMTVACETDLLTSPTHCGACGRRCPGDVDAQAGCAGGACALACAPGFLDCNGDLGMGGDGCETQAAACPRIEWSLAYGDASNDWPVGSGTHMDITTDPSGNIYAAPTTGPDLTFDGTPYALGRQGSLVFSLDGAGAPRWAVAVASDNAGGDAVVTNIEHDPTTGDVFITGSGFGGNLEIGGVSQGSIASACASFAARLDDATGAPVWTTIVANECSRADALAIGPAGEVYIGGHFGGASFTIGADTYSTAGGSDDAYVARLDPADGAFLSTFAIGGGSPGAERVDGIAVLSNGDLLLVGSAVGDDVTFGATTTPNVGGEDLFYARYTAAGAHVWSNVVGEVGSESLTNVELGPSGQAYVSGFYTTSITLGATTLNGSGMVLGRLDVSNGTFDWVTGHDGGASLFNGADNYFAVDANEVLHLGFTSSSSPTTTFAGAALQNVTSPRVASVDGVTGAAQRIETFAAPGGSFSIRALALSPAGEKIVIGFFDGTRSFDGVVMTSVGLIDHFVWRLTY